MILADAPFAVREGGMLSRLEVGLVDEGVRLVHAAPNSVARGQPGAPAGELFVRVIPYEDRGPGILRRLRDRRFAAELARLREPDDERPIDVIHVFGEGAWATGVDLAESLDAALAVEAWSAGLIPRIVRTRWPGGVERPPLVFFAPDRAIETRLRDEVERHGVGAVRLTPWGVHTPAHAHELLPPNRAPSAMIAGSGRDPEAWAAVLSALAAPGPQTRLMIFADAEAVAAARAWPVVNRLGLTDRFTLTPSVEARRELTLQCDLLILPEALGEHRSLTLDAMAAGVVVIAAADPMVAVFAEGTTARVVERPSHERWSAALAALLDNPDQARALAESARDHVRRNQRASMHVASIADAYEWMTAGDTLPFGRLPHVR
ncbi:MAG: glycosyltransferase [Phycisphaerales bacterium]